MILELPVGFKKGDTPESTIFKKNTRDQSGMALSRGDNNGYLLE